MHNWGKWIHNLKSNQLISFTIIDLKHSLEIKTRLVWDFPKRMKKETKKKTHQAIIHDY